MILEKLYFGGCKIESDVILYAMELALGRDEC